MSWLYSFLLFSDIDMLSTLKTRVQMSSYLSLLIDAREELPFLEFPTMRNVIKLGLLLRGQYSKDSKNYTDKELINDIITYLLCQWIDANVHALYKQLVIKDSRIIALKLMGL